VHEIDLHHPGCTGSFPALLGVLFSQKPQQALAAEDVFASPLNGGFYIAAANQCRIHIEPYTVNVGSGNKLQSLRLQSNGVAIYDFKTDVSNPPPAGGTTYTISNVAPDFAANCG